MVGSVKTGTVLDVFELKLELLVAFLGETSLVKYSKSKECSRTVRLSQRLDECIGHSFGRGSRALGLKVPPDVAASVGGGRSCLERLGTDAGAQQGAAQCCFPIVSGLDVAIFHSESACGRRDSGGGREQDAVRQIGKREAVDWRLSSKARDAPFELQRQLIYIDNTVSQFTQRLRSDQDKP
jgi:hypothetical protein